MGNLDKVRQGEGKRRTTTRTSPWAMSEGVPSKMSRIWFTTTVRPSRFRSRTGEAFGSPRKEQENRSSVAPIM
jgi:hypothetical protein